MALTVLALREAMLRGKRRADALPPSPSG